MSALIITDSRGRGLQEALDKLSQPWVIRVLVHPGAGYELAVIKSLTYIRKNMPTLIIMLLGVCDLTWKNGRTRLVGLRHRTVVGNVDHLIGAIKASFDILSAVGDFKISYATLTGLDLADTNNPARKHMSPQEYEIYMTTMKVVHPDQGILDAAVIDLNKRIITLNKQNGVRTAWMAGLVHSYIRGKHHHYYRRLLDGCHLDDRTKAAWAAQLVKSIKRIGI